MAGYKPLKVGERRRAEILEVAISLFSTRGIEGTSFQKIGDLLNISQSAVIHHFRNKMELFKATLLHIVTKNHEMVKNGQVLNDSSLKSLRSHCVMNLKWLVDNPDEAKVILYLYQQGAINEHIAPVAQQVIKSGRDRIINILRDAQLQNEISSSVDVEVWGQLLHEFLAGSLILGISEKGNFTDHDIELFKVKLDRLIENLK